VRGRGTRGETLLFQSVVIEFFREHGLNLNEVRLWTLPWCVPAASHEYSTIRSADPLEVEVRIPLDGKTLVVTLDGVRAVVGTERATGTP
jgi:hypothetical protein